MTTLNVYK